jgi:hypothetical protein
MWLLCKSPGRAQQTIRLENFHSKDLLIPDLSLQVFPLRMENITTQSTKLPLAVVLCFCVQVHYSNTQLQNMDLETFTPKKHDSSNNL